MKQNLLHLAVISGLFQQAANPDNQQATAGAANNAAPGAADAPLKAPIPAAPFDGAVMEPVKFHFKKNELGEKRPTVELYAPMPTWEGLNAALSDTTLPKDREGKEIPGKTNGEKVRDLVLELLGGAVVAQVRDQVSDEKNPINKQEELDTSKLSLQYIASIPPSERRGGGISKETWADFFKDYMDVMPEKTGKKKEQVENAAKLFVARLQPVKTQKKILAFLRDQLNLWFTSTTQDSQEEFAEVKEFLDGKIEEFLKRDEAELLANL